MRRPTGHFLATGAALALAGGSTEPVSIPDKRSTIRLRGAGGPDADNVGFRLRWPTQMDCLGQ
jgi:hypothetical protein